MKCGCAAPSLDSVQFKFLLVNTSLCMYKDRFVNNQVEDILYKEGAILHSEEAILYPANVA